MKNELFAAIFKNDLAAVNNNLHLITEKDQAGWTALQFACAFSQFDIRRILLKNHIINKDDYTERALVEADINAKIVSKLLDLMNIDDINYQDRLGWSALMLTARDNNILAANHLLKQDINLNAKNHVNKTAIQIALDCHNYQLAQLIYNKQS